MTKLADHHPDFLGASLPEDVAMGMAMRHVNVTFIAGVNNNNQLLFTPEPFENYQLNKLDHWYTRLKKAKMADGRQDQSVCCAGRDELISMHYVKPAEMIKLEWMLAGD